MMPEGLPCGVERDLFYELALWLEMVQRRLDAAEAAARDFAEALRHIRDGETVTRGAVTYVRPGWERAGDALARHPEFSEESGT
jgi:hypothetical protein